MQTVKNLSDWMTECKIEFDELVAKTALDRRILEAILQGRYTPSPQQRQSVAAALGVEPDQIAWGHVNPVEHVYGHGPQFGRTP